MAERPSLDDGLERALTELGRHLAYPSVPDLRAAVRTRITIGPRRRHFPDVIYSWPRLAGAAAAALLVAAAVLLAVSAEARDAVADRLGLRGVHFFAVPESASPTPTGSPAAGGGGLLGGTPVALAEARARAGFPLRLPGLPDVGEPDEVYFNGAVPGGVVTLAYAPRLGLPEASATGIGLLITQFRGEYEPFLQKGLPAGARLQPVSVGGARGYWIEGAPHVLLYRDAAGNVHEERSRLAGNTLLWERDGVVFRVESALRLEDALRIAESLR